MIFSRFKNIDSVKEVSNKGGLPRTLTAVDLLLLGIGAIIGTGIFVITGMAAARYAGPSISMSLLVDGIICIFVALAYVEVAAMIPTSGSVYTYSYVGLGELIAWIVGWILILEYTLGASTVASGWSGYIVGLLKESGIIIPEALTKVPSEGGIINLPAVFITLVMTSILIRGTKESAIINNILVAIKIVAIFFFIIVAFPKIKTSNYQPFMPFGVNGMISGAAIMFFSFIGFDMIATATEECKNPKRDVTIGIIGSLLASTLLYMLVAGVLTGIISYTELDNAEPVAHALRANGSTVAAYIIGIGAVAAMPTVLMVQMYGQSRIFMVMSRDGLLPSAFNKIHSKFGTPYLSTLLVGTAVVLISGFTPIHIIANLTSVGTLFAFIMVSIVVMVLRKKHPNVERPFTCPAVYVVAPLAVALCGYLMKDLLVETGGFFVKWSILGLVVYYLYGRKKSGISKG
jgi:APA family basic amino acid/polyamine antiporter